MVKKSLSTCSVLLAIGCGLLANSPVWAQDPPAKRITGKESVTPGESDRRLSQLWKNNPVAQPVDEAIPDAAYRIGPEDLLEISVFEAPELNRSIRVASNGELSFALLGMVRAEGLTPRELEIVLQELLRRTFIKDPHVGVFVQEMESHPVAVVGAVQLPGVFQIRGPRTVLEMLSMAQGLSPEAGDKVLVVRGRRSVLLVDRMADTRSSEDASARPAGDLGGEGFVLLERMGEAQSSNVIEIDLKDLVESGDAGLNVLVYPGDAVKVPRAGVVYVVGEVNRAGGFRLNTNEKVSVLQALALAEGLTATAAKGRVVIVRNDATGQRQENLIDLGRILAGKDPDPILEPNDILFVPNSTTKVAIYRGLEAVIRTLTGFVIFNNR